jgi:hypothetical protein
MSKIQNVRLPNSPTAQYSPEQFNQLVRSLEQVIFQLNTTYTAIPDQNVAASMLWMKGHAPGVRGFQLDYGVQLPHAMVMNQSDLNNLGATVENILTYDTPIFERGIHVEAHEAEFTGGIDDGAGSAGTVLTVSAVASGTLLSGMTLSGTGVTAGTRIVSQTSGTTGGAGVYVVDTSQLVSSTTIQGSRASKLMFDHTGQYFVTLRCQGVNSDNVVHEMELWAKDSGTDYPYSNTRYDVPVRKNSSVWGHTVADISGIFTVTDPANSYLEMAWWSDSTLVYMEAAAENTSPTRPAISSVILTVTMISAETV